MAPEKPDTDFIKRFKNLIFSFLKKDEKRKFIFVVGGGGPARVWQQAYREVQDPFIDEEADWIGIMATRLNARLIKAAMAPFCTDELVTDPTQLDIFTGRILVASGWKPGFSTDYDAVLLAEPFQAGLLINLSNIEKVYTADPKLDPDAQPIDSISWPEFRAMVGDSWTPGKNLPFDPNASRHAARLNLKVICAAGRNLENLEKILLGQAYEGTEIG